jgi:hypothetical protein
VLASDRSPLAGPPGRESGSAGRSDVVSPGGCSAAPRRRGGGHGKGALARSASLPASFSTVSGPRGRAASGRQGIVGGTGPFS